MIFVFGAGVVVHARHFDRVTGARLPRCQEGEARDIGRIGKAKQSVNEGSYVDWRRR